ncbi:efflux RND transporter periplasmic adaptor subunit [Pelagicoccus sp. SDUM812005]|uniref:efflux RND transporter periplasmic adaptor subunit n=1 Tax=Pelagicoccus sp. SDUM812005 TaxID=3041257 RepID=UPI00280E0692|nr:efflux RND transporter periplasmic adaptor subunit [Pelagicoccus sp. SDUM812005]MDQ8181969.1 efflux RND transporter periplasmic adaptor subunit [Pelagicoccus sp. SDUM812005]
MKKVFIISLLVQLCVTQMQAQATGAAAPPTPVIVTKAVSKPYADEVEALGTLRANESVELTSSVTEIVKKVSFDDSQRVKKGDVLVEMDTAEELAEMAEQESIMAEAQRQVNRLKPLIEQGAASTSTLTASERDLAGAKARMQAIESRIDQRVIKAPFDGVLGLRNISVGALAQPGSVIATIDDVSVMKLDFSVPEVFLSTLKPGVVIEAETEAYRGRVFEGRIANVDSRIDPVTRSIKARALIDNEEGLLKPGLLMKVELQKDPRDALLVPEEALVTDGPEHFVFVVVGPEGKQTVERRKVKIGTRSYGEAEVLSGLSVGELVVTHGTLRLRMGAPVVIKAVEKNGESLGELLKGSSAKQ